MMRADVGWWNHLAALGIDQAVPSAWMAAAAQVLRFRNSVTFDVRRLSAAQSTQDTKTFPAPCVVRIGSGDQCDLRLSAAVASLVATVTVDAAVAHVTLERPRPEFRIDGTPVEHGQSVELVSGALMSFLPFTVTYRRSDQWAPIPVEAHADFDSRHAMTFGAYSRRSSACTHVALRLAGVRGTMHLAVPELLANKLSGSADKPLADLVGEFFKHFTARLNGALRLAHLCEFSTAPEPVHPDSRGLCLPVSIRCWGSEGGVVLAFLEDAFLRGLEGAPGKPPIAAKPEPKWIVKAEYASAEVRLGDIGGATPGSVIRLDPQSAIVSIIGLGRWAATHEDHAQRLEFRTGAHLANRLVREEFMDPQSIKVRVSAVVGEIEVTVANLPTAPGSVLAFETSMLDRVRIAINDQLVGIGRIIDLEDGSKGLEIVSWD